MANEAKRPRLVVGISGASGIIYGIRMLQALRPLGIESHLVMSRSAEVTLAYETDMKARDVAAYASEFQALDRLKVAKALDRRLQTAERTLPVFVQVNTSREPQKYGIQPEELPDFLTALQDYPTLKVQGLMTLAIFTPEVERVRECFRLLRTLRDQMRDDAPELIGPGELSMGMSGDFEVAIEEGSTVVRVGQAIFGARETPDSYYWPGIATPK